MKILFIATKSPWPAVDGGRLLVARTLDGLAALGHRVTLVAPALSAETPVEVPEGSTARLVPARPRPLPISAALSILRGRAVSVTRHSLEPVRREVARLLDTESFDVVHVEQLQALAQAEPAFERDVPVVLRAQNVESDLWEGTARALGLLGFLAKREARRLAQAEGDAVSRVRRTAALTREDARRLGELASGRGELHVVRAPFPPSLPAADAPLEGRPALTLLGSEGWLPNRDAVDWFVSSIWPEVRSAVAEARLHVYGHLKGTPPEGATAHPPPADSREVFAPGSVMVVPLRIGSGVRMKILEAWARGVPIVATPEAVRGLEAEAGREVLVARGAEEFADAFRRLAREPELAVRLVENGRESLARRHDPAKVIEELARLYEALR